MNTEIDAETDDDLKEVCKRLPPKFHTNVNDVYITRKTNIAAQFNKCKKLLDCKSDEIVIHALGMAINQALTLAIKLEHAMKNSIKLDVLTSSVNVTDDIFPILSNAEVNTYQRAVSAVHIRVSRIIYN